MKKYRNMSQYIVLEQGKVFLAGQAHELASEPVSQYLVLEATETAKPKATKSEK